MSEAAWNGRRATAFTAAVLAEYGTTCHLCLKPGATTADHLVARSRGGSRYDLANARPAHLTCNSRRGNRPITPALLATFRQAVEPVESWSWFS